MTIKKNIHLYPYQSEMVSRIAKSLGTYRSVMVQMPTGTGKTHIIAAVTKSFIDKGSYVWIIAHRRELVSQITDTVSSFVEGKERTNVDVYSVQWLTRHLHDVKTVPSLVVIDVCYSDVINKNGFP